MGCRYRNEVFIDAAVTVSVKNLMNIYTVASAWNDADKDVNT